MVISLGRRLLGASSGLPGSRNGPNRPAAAAHVRARSIRSPRGPPHCSLFGFAPGGVCRAGRVTSAAGALLPHRFTLTGRGARGREKGRGSRGEGRGRKNRKDSCESSNSHPSSLAPNSSPLATPSSPLPRRFAFCCTFPGLAAGRCYRPPCPVEPGLSSRRERLAPCAASDHPAHSETVVSRYAKSGRLVSRRREKGSGSLFFCSTVSQTGFCGNRGRRSCARHGSLLASRPEWRSGPALLEVVEIVA